ncbi:MAG: hypothetical protein R2991_02675 [Thermoanaerobaculia bacterium]
MRRRLRWLLLPLSFAAAAGAQTEPNLDAFGLIVAVQSRPSFAIVGAGARPAGMAGAFTAVADDASAASFNPAGLALLLTPEASLVIDQFEREDSFGAFVDLENGIPETYGPSASSFDATGLNFLSFTYPLTAAGRNLSLQLSFHRAIDFTFESDRVFDESAAGVPAASLQQSVRQTGDVDTLTVAAAYQLTPRTSLGLTVSRWTGDWTFTTSTRETEIDGDGESFLSYSQTNDWEGWNVSLGALLRYRYLNVGATARLPFDGDFSVSSTLTTNFETPFEPTSHSDATLEWPGSWTLGLALKPLETWFITVDYAEYDWDDALLVGLADQPLNFFDLKPEDESTTRNTGQWRYGTEYTFFAGKHLLAVRGGWFDLPRPQLLSPGDEKSSRRGFALGFGWKAGNVALDVAYQRSTSSALELQFVDPETVGSGIVSAQAVGKVETTDERLFLSALYRFPSRSALNDLFHFLFVGGKDAGKGG